MGPALKCPTDCGNRYGGGRRTLRCHRRAAVSRYAGVVTDASFTSVDDVRPFMTLETLSPGPDAAGDAVDEAVLDALAADDYRFNVWGGDWCGDCQRQLPAFAAALAAAGVPDDRIEGFPVTKGPDGKEGPRVDEYGVDRIPTVVVETADGQEIARFVEEADVSIAEALARQLADGDAPA